MTLPSLSSFVLPLGSCAFALFFESARSKTKEARQKN
jgi:hypothetical protein